MTTAPSSAPWADGPFELIPTPSTRMDISLGHVYCASEMAHAHNGILRGLNAILLQAPNVPVATDERFVAQDVTDLLFFVQSWTKMVNHHHWVEESYTFSHIEKLTGRPGLMDGPKHEHELFHKGLEALLEYASTTSAHDYRWEGPGGMKAIMESFSKSMADHLYAEIDVLLGMESVDGEGLRDVWAESERLAKQSGNLAMLYDVFPTVLGCVDKTYEGGQHNFPPLPSVVPYIVKYWFARGNGAWRFSPCDLWGQPQPLAFGSPRSA